MGRGGEKAKDLVGTWKKLLGYCRKYAAVMVIALICAVAGTVLTLAGPDKLSDMTNAISEGMAPDTEKLEEIVGAVYANLSAGGADLTIDGTVISSADQQQLLTVLGGLDGEDTSAVLGALNELPDSVSGLIEPSIDMNKITEIGLLLVSFYALSLILSAAQSWIMSTVTQRVSKEMRSEISRKINRLPMWFYHRTTTGDVLSRVTNDVDTIGQSLNQSIGNLISSVVLFLGSFLMMLLTDGWMTLTAVLSSLLGFVLMFAIMGKSQKYFTRQQKHLGRLNGHIEEIYAATRSSRLITARRRRRTPSPV